MTGEHTLLINMVVGLCNDGEQWPSFLHELGYVVKFLEQVLPINEKEKTKPDIIIVSNKIKHMLIIECKGGGSISAEQDMRYGKLEVKSIAIKIGAGGFIDKHVVAYAINHTSLKEIKKQTARPIIVFSPLHVKGIREFGVKKLNETMHRETSLTNMRVPTKYYPFGLDDDKSVVVTHIVQCIVKFTRDGKAIKNITGDDSINDMFNAVFEFQKILPSRHVKEIKKKIKKTIVEEIIPNKELMKRIEEVYKSRNQETRNQLYDFCGLYMKKIMPQKKLIDFT